MTENLSFEQAPNNAVNPFVQAAMQDRVLRDLHYDYAALSYREVVCAEHVTGVPSDLADQLQKSKAQVEERRRFLGEAWQEVGGNESSFWLLVEVRDLQAAFEADPDNQELRAEVQGAKKEYEASLGDPI